ncbi:MAG: hypothetical protein JRJ57_00305 [Deltaproteobacteria bacterium]|nr:hypothetical protein [Deltaproteobacteria bacterium]
MKTVRQVEKEIKQKAEELSEELNGGRGYNKRRVSLLKNKIATLKQIKTYLQCNPREEYLKGEKDRIEKRIESIEEKYLTWAQWNATRHKEPRDAFEKEMGIPRMKTQLEQLKVILGEL